MSYKIRDISKRVAQEHPELLPRSERLWLFVEQRRQAVIIAVLIAGLAAIILGTLVWFQQSRDQEALDLEYQAAQAYLDRSFEDVEATNKRLQKAVTVYRQIIEDYPRSPHAHLSWYFIGNALAEQRDYAGAVDAYNNFIKQTGTHPALLGLVYQRLGATYVADGNRKKGMEAYNHVLEVPEALNKDQVLFELAKLEEFDNRTSQALALYQRLLNDHARSPYASEAKMRIKILEPPKEESAATPPEEETPQEEGPQGKEKEP